MSKPFAFKQFVIKQEKNPQKVGTDSMLLGAWVSDLEYNRILDVGTGTGILALMCAQRFKNASIIAIEPDLPSLQEALENFNSSPFSQQISAVNCSLQAFKTDQKFDLIISNPPYFESAFLSTDQARNRARHTTTLPISTFYECTQKLLDETGNLVIIIPYDLAKTHLEKAKTVGLSPFKLLHTKKVGGNYKRTLIHYSKKEIKCFVTEEIIVKDDKNNYSADYIALTKEFYIKDLKSHS